MGFEERKDQLITETIENLFAILQEADLEFRVGVHDALATTLTGWVEANGEFLRHNLLGKVVIAVVNEEDKAVADTKLLEEGHTCLDLLSPSPDEN